MQYKDLPEKPYPPIPGEKIPEIDEPERPKLKELPVEPQKPIKKTGKTIDIPSYDFEEYNIKYCPKIFKQVFNLMDQYK